MGPGDVVGMDEGSGVASIGAGVGNGLLVGFSVGWGEVVGCGVAEGAVVGGIVTVGFDVRDGDTDG